MQKIHLIGIILFLVSFSCLHAQMGQLEARYLGTDDLIANGIIYRNSHPNADGNPFFPSERWQNCHVFVKGKSFDGVAGKLDLEKGHLLLSNTLPTGSKQIYKMNETLVDSFIIAGHIFVHKRLLDAEIQGLPFLEKVYSGNATLVLKHNKHYIPKFNATTPHGAYSRLKTDRLLIRDQEVFRIKKRRHLWTIAFPDHKKEIKKFLRANKISYKKATIQQLNQILSFCDER